MRKIVLFISLLFLIAGIYELIHPTKVEYQPPELTPVFEENFWIEAQKGDSRRPVSSKYYLDNPTEAWHEAEANDDADDPEIYNNVYDGK